LKEFLFFPLPSRYPFHSRLFYRFGRLVPTSYTSDALASVYAAAPPEDLSSDPAHFRTPFRFSSSFFSFLFLLILLWLISIRLSRHFSFVSFAAADSSGADRKHCSSFLFFGTFPKNPLAFLISSVSLYPSLGIFLTFSPPPRGFINSYLFYPYSSIQEPPATALPPFSNGFFLFLPVISPIFPPPPTFAPRPDVSVRMLVVNEGVVMLPSFLFYRGAAPGFFLPRADLHSPCFQSLLFPPRGWFCASLSSSKTLNPPRTLPLYFPPLTVEFTLS